MKSRRALPPPPVAPPTKSEERKFQNVLRTFNEIDEMRTEKIIYKSFSNIDMVDVT